MKPSKHGSLSRLVEMSPKSGMLIETYKNVNISAEYQLFCMKPSEQGLFSEAAEMSPRSGMLRSKLTKM